MSFLKWNDEYKLGIPEIDKQHQKWIEILNRFYDNSNNTDLNEKIKKLIKEVLDYTEYHFQEEEKFMSIMNYSNVRDQKEMHNQLLKKITDFKDQVDSGKTVLSLGLTSELKSWLKQHIMVEDKKYAEIYLSMKK